jgi:hypothetical protein
VIERLFSPYRAMKAPGWKTYRTRFLVKAKRLSSDLSFTDFLGREHSGHRGDYLVETSDGVFRIMPRHFFEDAYVPMTPLDEQKLLGPDELMRARRKQPTTATNQSRPSPRLEWM